MKAFNFVFAFIFLIVSPLFAERSIPISLEYAVTPTQRNWGLMGRSELPKNHGMLFVYPLEQKLSFWTFNCLVDFSIAFIDNQGFIKEIKELKSYPGQMDPKRPVRNINDLKKYPPDDPIILFYFKNNVSSESKVSLALEMNSHWFEDHKVKVGDKLLWQPFSPIASILSYQKN